MNSFMSWVGGKKSLREDIVSRLNHQCDRYVEVFGGGGWVLFYKDPWKFEVYNDFNPNLTNLYRCVRDFPDALCAELEYTLNSRLDFYHIREVLHTKTVVPDIKRAAYFIKLFDRVTLLVSTLSVPTRTKCGTIFPEYMRRQNGFKMLLWRTRILKN